MRTGRERDKIFDLIVKTVNEKAEKPIKIREKKIIRLDDNQIFILLCYLIAYSQRANSKRVKKEVIKSGTLKKALANGNYLIIAKRNKRDFIEKYWASLKAIRFKKKLGQMIEVAKSLKKIKKKHGSFMNFLESFGLPKKIKTQAVVDNFWEAAKQIHDALNGFRMPAFRNITSLMHLLRDLGYPCLKPDSTVMRIMFNVGLVEKRKGKTDLIKVVRTVQQYCLSRNITPSIMDQYLLMFGGQSVAREEKGDTFCKPSKECNTSDCPIRKHHLCVIVD